ncbi:MAG TPA: inositol monophosphatase family protein, partial [Longimicrobiaceae bacterium]|nr:inositol monophosphatase family protein [Longimicrobiaceae bacterium]
MSAQRSWQAELDLAVAAARAAGELTLRWFQKGPAVELKADASPVTEADRAAEQRLRERIRARYPDDGILGEEGGEEPGRSGRRWVLDPIDGTRSFIHGVPLYGVMVALEAGGEPVLGVLHFPALGDTVAAARGLGCRWNGRPARVSATARLADALVLTSGDLPATRVPGLQRLSESAGSFRTWGDCYGYALVATGRAEAMLDPELKVWDAAAVRPVIEEAGGVFTDWSG